MCEEGFVVGLVVPFVRSAAQAVSLGVADPAHQFLGIVLVLFRPVLRELVEQIGMRNGIVFAEVVRVVLGEALAEEMAPGAVDERLGEIVVGGDELGQGFATRPLEILGDLLAAQVSRVREQKHGVASFVRNELGGVEGGIVLDGVFLGPDNAFFLLGHHHAGPAVGLDLAEEGVDAPEMVLAPFAVEGVIVALDALGADAEEEPGSTRGGRHHIPLAVLAGILLDFLAEVVQHVIDSRIAVGVALAADEIRGGLRPVGGTFLFALELVVEPIVHLGLIMFARARAGQQMDRPQVREVLGVFLAVVVFLAVEQGVDQPGAAVFFGMAHEGLDFVNRRNAANDIE